MLNSFSSFDKKNDVIIGLTDVLKSNYIYKYFMESNEDIVVVVNSMFECNKIYNYLISYTENVYLFPMDDFVTSEALAVSPELKMTRIDTLSNTTKKIIITNLMGYLRYLPTKKVFDSNIITLSRNDCINKEELVNNLFQIGYVRNSIVNKTGELANRGFVLDLFPVSSNNPIRLEFWGDVIESIKEFDVSSQRTLKEIKDIKILPNTEFIVNKNVDVFNLNQSDLIKYGNIKNISTFFEATVFFYKYDELKISYENLLEEIQYYNESNNKDKKYMYLFDEIKNSNEKYLLNFNNNIFNKEYINYNSKEIKLLSNNKKEIIEFINKMIKKYKLIIFVKDRYKANKVIEFLEDSRCVLTSDNDIRKNYINIIISNINEGYIIDDYCVLTEKELFNKKSESKYINKFKLGTKIRDINKLVIGDYVVHSSYGIGRYNGIKTLIKNNLKKDYLMIEYKNNDKLYIPVEKIEFINKFSEKDGVAPKLNKLGSNEWEKTKLRAKKRIESMAIDLMELYAKRENSMGFCFDEDGKEQIAFENEFPFKETNDQLKVISEIKHDMEKAVPMDRLLCGDVGYGKTEVAFRAIFKAIISGKQVSFLCPTTILSNQHFYNALERFSSFPVNIRLLNRFTPKKMQNIIIEEIKSGKVDLLIGTHRILSDDIKFKDLGLLIIDEEQRFGVTHKEKIKVLKNNIDILTLSATPIPRTLQMSMSGIRNLSLIETPPIDRHPIQTYVLQENDYIIKDSIYKELSRSGQVFILFNNINNLEKKQAEINKLVPEAKIVIAHGQMTKNELENIMTKFIDKEYDVLLCTTIIETGIDIPNANTLIIFDADRFGLSQLYQLRGRVGRSNRIAYCYLMYNNKKILSEIASKRLNAIKDFTELGSGFSIAMRDLSIRGAGDILGSEQAGFIDAIGIDLFMQMLNDEVERLKGNKIEERKDINPLIEVSTTIDNDIVNDTDIKIEIHKKINQIDSEKSLFEIRKEIIDRFGNINDDIEIYMQQELFEKIANDLNIKEIKQSKNFIEIVIPNSIIEYITPQELFMKVATNSKNFRFKMKERKLIVILDLVNLEKHFIYYLLDLLNIIKKILRDKNS